MTRATNLLILAGMLVCLAMGDAAAWGDRAQRSISYMALQVIQKDHPDTLREYERDVLQGSVDGWAVLADSVPMNSDAEVVAAVNGQIQLLRDVRQYGVGSYFAYRMGVLASLVADALLPYGIPWTPNEKALHARMSEDIDAHLDSFKYTTLSPRRTYIRHAEPYLAERRTFLQENLKLIADDYARGSGYDGYLGQAAPVYFTKAVDAVSDAWYTVMRVDPDSSDQPASRASLTWFLVSEIEYLLAEKKNFVQTDLTYSHFEKVNPGLVEAFERVGDLYYAFGTEQAKDRAVREWRTAHGLSGTNRANVGKKLANHYLKVGRHYLEEGKKPRSSDTDLPKALQSFQEAMLFNRDSAEAARGVQDANVAIADREERLRVARDFIANAERVRAEAARGFAEQDFGTAITKFKQAISLFDAVGDDFEKEASTAKEGVSAVKKDIAKVIQTIIDKATEAIDAGDSAREEHRYDDAIMAYSQVDVILGEIPDDSENQTATENKQELMTMARTKIDEAKREQVDYLARLEEARKNPAPAGGARPAQPAAGGASQ